MKFSSCRGLVSGISFEEVLFKGYASDGGMFIPDELPKVSMETIKSWSTFSYKEIVKNIIPLFVSEDEIPRSDVNGLVEKAYSRFRHPDIVTMKRMKDGLNVLEMCHGPTYTFKDVSCSVVGQLLEYFLKKNNKHIIVLIVTSGDTGSSCIEAVRGMANIDVICCLPGKGRISSIQEHMMTTVLDDNIHVYRVDAKSDDIDIVTKRIFMDTELSDTNNIISLNSVNWARVMVQIAHYFYAYFQLSPNCDDIIDVIVPTGGCGNITSGSIAKLMGLPIRLSFATTSNDVMFHAVNSGEFVLADKVVTTLAPAMDIGNPYNFQRILFYLSEKNSDMVRDILTKVDAGEKVQIPENLLKKVKELLLSYRADDTKIKEAMNRCYHDNNYLVCPHTATAVACYYDNRERYKKAVCISTASPLKFVESVKAVGLKPETTEDIDKLLTMPTRYTDVEAQDYDINLNNLIREKIKEISN